MAPLLSPVNPSCVRYNNALACRPISRRPEADFKQALSDVLLHCADRLSQLLGDRLASQRLHVEVVGACREYDERHDSHFARRVLHAHSLAYIVICMQLYITPALC